MSTSSIISVRNFSKKYGENVILKNVNVEIQKGEVISIIGPSGTGKSTFLRGLNMLDPPTGGEVWFDGVKIEKSNMDTIRRRMGMVFQNFGLFSHLDVLGNLMIGQTKLLGKTEAEAEEKARELLLTVGLSDRANHFPRQLSGGQKQRVAIARCLTMSPEVILFDEPTSALDPTMVGEVMAVIRSLAKSGMTMLVVTHEMSFARDVSNRVFYMDEQGIYEEGTPDEIFKSPQKEKTREFIFKIRNFDYAIESRGFDYAELLGGVENFCFRHAIDSATAERLRLITEELIINIVVPRYGKCTLRLSFSDALSRYELVVNYEGENENAVDYAEDELTTLIIQKMAREISHMYNEGRNTLSIGL